MDKTVPQAIISPTVAAAKPDRRFPLRYLRLVLVLSLVYAVMFLAIALMQGRHSVDKLPTVALVSIVFGAMMTLYFALLEARAMKQLGIPLEMGEGVPKPVQRRELVLAISHEEAVARIEAALFQPGITLDRGDPTAGLFLATAGQTWKGYGEKISVSLSGSQPARIVVESRPRLNILGIKVDYGKNWENVEAIQARLLRDPALASDEGEPIAGGLGLTVPPKCFEVGAWQRLLPVLLFYCYAIVEIIRRATELPESTPQMPALMLATLPMAGAMLELWAFSRFRRVAQFGPRLPEQETLEAMLNNGLPVLFALGLLMRPQLALWSGENIAAITFASVFVYFGVRRTVERGRERSQRETITEQREKAELQRQLAEARLAALAAQIEPHFLFNTLASIQYLTRNDADKAHAMVSDLIRYLRLALPRMKKATAQLADELQLVQAYLSIMQIRMGPRLRFQVDHPASLGEHNIPTMVLITLVENAIKHGLERLNEGGEVHVSVSADDAVLTLVVADTGGGFSTASSGTGIGLANVRERLRTLYGERGQLALAANEPHGVRATVTIPLEKT